MPCVRAFNFRSLNKQQCRNHKFISVGEFSPVSSTLSSLPLFPFPLSFPYLEMASKIQIRDLGSAVSSQRWRTQKNIFWCIRSPGNVPGVLGVKTPAPEIICKKIITYNLISDYTLYSTFRNNHICFSF